MNLKLRLARALKAMPLRYWLVVLLLAFAGRSDAQTPTNPNNPSTGCGLPEQGGVIVESVTTYNLTKNCTMTGWLEIKTSQTPNITLTINGMGHTITSSTCLNTTYLCNFLIVDDDGEATVQNVENGRSPNVKVIIKNVTFNGSDVRFLRPRRLQPDNVVRRSAIGAGILVDGDLTMENVTFTNGNGIWVRAKGTATLTNVLFENSRVWSWGFGTTPKGVLLVDYTGNVTLNKAVFRDIHRAVVYVRKGGRLSTTGCLSFIRVVTHKVSHSGFSSNLGSWSDSSTGPCTGEIGNNGQAVVAYTLPTLDCSQPPLPSGGAIEGTVVYTLSQNCVCVNQITIAAGANVTINGNGFNINGCETGSPHILIGDARLTVNNANINRIRIRNYGGIFTLRNSMIAAAPRTAILNYGWAYLYDSVFQDNTGSSSGEGNVYYAHGWFGRGLAIFGDNVFRNNGPTEVEAFTTGPSTRIYLCGENIIEGLSEDEESLQFALFIAENGGAILGCNDDHPTPVSAAAECVPAYTDLPADMLLGAIGIIFYKQTCPAAIEVWEVLPDSRGQFALRVSQPEVDAVAEGVVACSSNGRTAVRVGLTEPVRQLMIHSKAYQAPGLRGARDILISVGPDHEGKVNHIVLDNSLEGHVLGTVTTWERNLPCSPSAPSFSSQAPPAAAPAPVYAPPVSAQTQQADGSIIHVVRPGDTIWQIGIAYNVHPYRIIALNQLDQLRNGGSYIFPGQELLVRPAQ